MDTLYFFQGLFIGIAITAPIGPIAFLCIQRTLYKGRIAGIVSGLGSTTADVFYVIVSIIGIHAISHFIYEYILLLYCIRVSIFVVFGIQIFNANIPLVTQMENKTALLKDYGSTLLLTLANPATILLFSLFIATYQLDEITHGTYLILPFVLGVITGAVIWWAILIEFVYQTRLLIMKYLIFINKVVGTLLVLFGILTFLSLFVSYSLP